MHAPVTLLYGGLCGLIVVALGLNVSLHRVRHRASMGHVPDALVRPVRAHANAAEWTAIAIVLLLVVELSGAHSHQLHMLGGAFLLGRLLHAYGALRRSTRVVMVAAAFTYGTVGTLSVLAVRLHFATT